MLRNSLLSTQHQSYPKQNKIFGTSHCYCKLQPNSHFAFSWVSNSAAACLDKTLFYSADQIKQCISWTSRSRASSSSSMVQKITRLIACFSLAHRRKKWLCLAKLTKKHLKSQQTTSTNRQSSCAIRTLFFTNKWSMQRMHTGWIFSWNETAM